MTIEATSDDYLQKQAISTNCIGTFQCPPWPQPAYTPPQALVVEPVANGFIIKGYFQGKGEKRFVATDSKKLAKVVAEWASQGK